MKRGKNHNGSPSYLITKKHDTVDKVLFISSFYIGPFQVFFTRGRGRRCFPAASPIPAKKPKRFNVVFYLLSKQYEKIPKEQEQITHLQAGLGRRTAHLEHNTWRGNNMELIFAYYSCHWCRTTVLSDLKDNFCHFFLERITLVFIFCMFDWKGLVFSVRITQHCPCWVIFLWIIVLKLEGGSLLSEGDKKKCPGTGICVRPHFPYWKQELVLSKTSDPCCE